MGRSGSSSRRKSSNKRSLKVSPEVRRKKRSKRNKSKKLRRHDDSFSSCSDDESTSSSLLSSSSSDGAYRSKRSRSRARNEVKGSKKKPRRRSLSEDSSEDLPLTKKRKGFKKKADSEPRKKNKKIKKKKKKSKRHDYISSSTSDSASCSTCKEGDSGSDEGGSHGRSRGRSREKKKINRDSTKGRDGNRKNRSKTRSSSPSKSSNNYSSDYESIEKMTVENNSRRLKSVITVAKPAENELKEEIVYDYDDYPSCKSNDSNELVDRSNISPEKKMLTSVIGEVNSVPSLNDSKEKESNASGNIEPKVDDLEKILRQKALENLSKFRGELKKKPVAPVVDKQKSDQTVVMQPINASVSMTPVSQPVIDRSRFTWRRDPSATSVKDEKGATYSGPDSGGSQPAAQKLPSAENEIVKETPKSVVDVSNRSIRTETNADQKSTSVIEAPSSASTEEGSSKEKQTESNDNSQFEKKTMSVMRGGEMVQVSYKVYIPNRAPALARRQLKR